MTSEQPVCDTVIAGMDVFTFQTAERSDRSNVAHGGDGTDQLLRIIFCLLAL